jgi:Predicted tRNA(5-methylaminomethyl-2-thiouridylate) methyltransferase, contains the PP-loop ATPase domain
MKKEKINVGMSGGVDSSVAAMGFKKKVLKYMVSL